MTEFGLKPPTLMLGTMKVDEQHQSRLRRDPERLTIRGLRISYLTRIVRYDIPPLQCSSRPRSPTRSPRSHRTVRHGRHDRQDDAGGHDRLERRPEGDVAIERAADRDPAPAPRRPARHSTSTKRRRTTAFPTPASSSAGAPRSRSSSRASTTPTPPTRSSRTTSTPTS